MTPETQQFASVVRPPGAPSPLGATWTPEGLNLAVRAPSAELVEACLFLGGDEIRVPLEARSHGVHHGFLPGVEIGTQYGLRAHGPWEPQRGLRFNPAKLLVDPYARAIVGDVTSPEVPRPATAGDPGGARHPRLGAVRAARRRRRRRVRLGRRRGPRHVVGRDGRLRDARQGLHRDAPRRSPSTCAGRTPASPTRRPSTTWCGSASPPSSCSRCTSSVAEPPLAARGTPQLLGLQHPRVLRPARRLRRRPQPRGAGRRVQGDGQGAARRRHRGAAGRRLQPHLRGRGRRAVADVPRPRRARPLQARTAQRGVRRHHGLRQHPRRRRPRRPAAGARLAALLGERDARRRLPLRPRDGAHARAHGLRRAVAVPRRGAPGPGAAPGEAHRRAVGRRPRRLPASAPSGRRGPSGTTPTATTCARFWRGAADGREAPADMGWRLTGSQDVFNGRSPAASVNFVTAHDGFTLRDLVSYNGKHNEANGEDNRDGSDNNRSWNHGVEGPTDDPAIEAGRLRTMRGHAGHAAALDRYADARSWATRSGARSGGNNNAYNQDNEHLLDGLGPRGVASATCSTGPRRSSRSAARTPRCARRSSSTGARSPRAARPTSRGSSRTAAPMTDAQWNDPAHRHAGHGAVRRAVHPRRVRPPAARLRVPRRPEPGRLGRRRHAAGDAVRRGLPPAARHLAPATGPRAR